VPTLSLISLRNALVRMDLADSYRHRCRLTSARKLPPKSPLQHAGHQQSPGPKSLRRFIFHESADPQTPQDV
jgi:hypothetical protein